ncbi:hypothetical protein DM01DRAFT_1408858 [Hesseltinella vesiculosa]|uniref:Uncharacterized protein n=1 Tax=Hesseltinella vesiculosa TaxID=101127 RepID=A0A1X2GCS3_9FUNG|nr:hypothetical protein DM01DRAFT_1408858 [Hesseltinella vesiculosa]
MDYQPRFRIYLGNSNWVTLDDNTTADLLAISERGTPTRYKLAPGVFLDILPHDVDCNSKTTDLARLMRADLCYDVDDLEAQSTTSSAASSHSKASVDPKLPVQQALSRYIKQELEKQGIIDAFPPTSHPDNPLPPVTSLLPHRHLALVPTPTKLKRPTASHLTLRQTSHTTSPSIASSSIHRSSSSSKRSIVGPKGKKKKPHTPTSPTSTISSLSTTPSQPPPDASLSVYPSTSAMATHASLYPMDANEPNVAHVEMMAMQNEYYERRDDYLMHTHDPMSRYWIPPMPSMMMPAHQVWPPQPSLDQPPLRSSSSSSTNSSMVGAFPSSLHVAPDPPHAVARHHAHRCTDHVMYNDSSMIPSVWHQDSSSAHSPTHPPALPMETSAPTSQHFFPISATAHPFFPSEMVPALDRDDPPSNSSSASFHTSPVKPDFHNTLDVPRRSSTDSVVTY